MQRNQPSNFRALAGKGSRGQLNRPTRPGRIQEQGLLIAQVVRARAGAPPAVFERKEVPLAALVAQLTSIEEVGPLVRQPVIARAFEYVRFPLLAAGLRAEVLDIAVADMG